MPNGNGGGGGGFDFGGFLDGLLGVLVAVIQAILDFLNALVQALVQILNFLFAGEQAIFDFGFKSLGDVFRGLSNILDRIFKQVVLAALKHLWDLYKKLRAWAEKLKKWIDRFHALQRKYQIAAFRRVINLIQRARKILVIFRVLHLKFATKLDHWLATVEARIISVGFKHARKTNEIIGVIDLILDPTVLFDGRLHLGSWARGLSAFAALLSGLGLKDLVPWLAPQLGPGVPVRKWSEAYAQFRTESKDNTGDTAAASRQFTQYAELFTQDIGGGGA